MKIKERGIAVIMAMLVVAVSAVLVSGAFLRQSAVARQVENELAINQAQRLLEGAVDWVRVILIEDARTSATDHLGEAWAVSLEQTRIDDESEDPAWISGSIEDAQSRFNLRNISSPNGPVASEMAVLQRLLAMVGADPMIASQIARKIDGVVVARAGSAEREPILPLTLDDIETGVPAVREALDRLRPFVTLIPVASPINANTAPAEVLAARFDNLSLVDARRLVESRDRAVFRDLHDLASRLQGVELTGGTGQVSVATQFFLVHGIAEFRRVRVQALALLRRHQGKAEVIWSREAAA